MSLPKSSQLLEQLVCLSSRRVNANGKITHRILSLAAIVLLCAASLWLVKTPIQAAGKSYLSPNAFADDQQISTVVAVSAASFDLGPVAPDSIVACFGANLATRVEIGATSPLPISLAGASVRVRDSQGVERQAGLFFVSPFQINLAIPANTAAGEAELIVTNGDSIVSRGRVQISRVAPGLFTASASGRGAPAGLALRVAAGTAAQTTARLARFDTQFNRYITEPVDVNSEADEVYLVLFGTGLRGRNAASDVTARIGGLNAPVLYAGAQGALIGLDQVNLGPVNRGELRSRLNGRGAVNLTIFVADQNGTVQRSTNVVDVELSGLLGTAPPQVNEPTATAVLAGQTVNVNGGPFFVGDFNANKVRIGNTPASVTAATADRLTVLLPYGVETGRISVSTPNGERSTTGSLQIATSVSGFVQTSERLPLAGVVVRSVGSSDEVTTRTDGSFVLPITSNTSSNVFQVTLQISPANVSGYQSYGTITRRFEVAAKRDNRMPAPVSLQVPNGAAGNLGGGELNLTLNVFGCTGDNAGAGVASFKLEAGTTAQLANSTSVTNVAFAQVQDCRAPQRQPIGLFSSRIVQVTPMGARFSPGGQLFFPNSDSLAPGTVFRLYRLDQQAEGGTGEFVDAGPATVSGDRARIETAPRAITEAGVYFVAMAPQSVTTLTGRVVEFNSSNAEVPTVGAIVSARGQVAFTDGDGAFVIRNVPVATVNDTLVVEASVTRPDGASDSVQRLVTSAVIRAGGTTALTPALLLNSFSSMTNRAPSASSQTVTTNEDTPRSITLGASDPDGNPLRYIYTLPSHGTLNGAPPFLLYTPEANYNGPDNFTFRVSDGKTESANAVVAITVNAVNDAPVLTVPGPQTVKEGEQIQFVIGATDVDAGQTLSVNANNLPSGANFISSERRFIWTPGCLQAGTYTVTFVAIDNGTPTPLSDAKSVAITVVDQNCAPQLVLPAPPTVNEGQALSFTVRANDPDVGQTITLGASNLPSGATFDAASGVFSWTPSCIQSGGYTVTFTATDNGSPVRSETRQLFILVNNVTVLPTFTAPESISVTEGQQVSFALTATQGCTNQNLAISGVSLPVGSSLGAPTTAGSQVTRQFTWTPNFNQSGAYALEFFVQDGADVNSIVRRTVQVTVLDFNRDPEFLVPGVRTIPVGQAFTLALSATDPDGQTVTLTATDLPQGATFQATPGNPATGTFAWTPAFNQISNFTVNFIATDSGQPARTITRSLLIVVNGDCDPILTVPNNQTVVELLPLTFSVVGSPRCPGQQVTLGANNLPPRATFNAQTGEFSWTPILGEVGTYTVNFTATDNNNPPRVVTRTVQVNVTGNRAPIATGLSVTLNEDTPTAITLEGTDPEGAAITYTIVTPPQHGTLSGTAPALTYMPVLNYNGPDSFTYRVSDGSLTSAPATVSLTIIPINDLPVVTNQSIAISEDAPANITLNGTDPDGDPLTFTITQQPLNGSLSGTAPNVTYTPNLNFFGTDEFRFRANDGKGNSPEGIISIIITQVNDAPTISVPGPQTFNAGQTVTFTVMGSDVETGQTLAFSAAPLPTGATFAQSNPSTAQFSWTPTEAQAGTYTINFTVTDNGAPQLSATKSVTIVINPTTTAIVITAPSELTVAENQLVSFAVSASGGTIGQSFSLSAVNIPVGASFPTATGTADTINQTFTWTPGFLQSGTYDITFTAARGSATSSRTVRVNVTNVCRPPVMANLTNPVNGTEGVPIVINVSATDPDTNETLTLTSQNLPAGATFPPTNGTNGTVGQQFNWTPAFNQSGTYVMSFIVSDNCAPTPLTDSRQITIVVADANRAPVATPRVGNDRITTTEDASVQVVLSATDGDGDLLTYSIVTPPTNGTLSGTAPNLTYLPAANFNGNDSFTFKVNDGKVDSAVATVEIAVSPACDPPVLTVPGTQNVTLTFPADCATQPTATPLTFNVSATDPDVGDLITLSAQNLPPGATFTQTSNTTGTFSWTPSVFTEAGTFAITFRATDNCSTVQTATSNVTVNFTLSTTPVRWTTTGLTGAGSQVTLLGQGTNLFAGGVGGGIFLTTNNGLNWPRVDQTGLNSTDIRAFVSKTATTGQTTVTTLFVGTPGGGVYRSTNNGVVWEQVNNGLNSTFVRALAVASDGTLFAGTQGNGAFYSTNDGTTWTQLNSGLSDLNVTALYVAGSGASARLYAGTESGAIFSLLVSDIPTASGAAWLPVSTGLPNTRVTNFEVSGTGTVLYASFGGSGVYRLQLGGVGNWESVSIGLNSNIVSDLLRVGNLLYAATDSGVARFNDGNATWDPLNECIPTFNINSLGANATGTKLFAGSSDGRVFIRPL